MNGNCQACLKSGVMDRAHIKSKGSGGGWESKNILLLCRMCHIASHKMGLYKFTEKYPHLLKELNKKGWKFEDVFGVKKLRKKWVTLKLGEF